MVIAGIHAVVPLQIVLAAALGAVIGLERELSAQPAGLRTHMLVSLGSALFTLVGADTLHTDPTRIAAQVVTGVGFLGGGAILREGVTIRGLTTAASLWMTAAIGLAIGMEQWTAAVSTTVIGLAVLLLVKRLENDILPRRRTLEITLTVEADTPIDHVVAQASTIVPRSRVLGVTYDATGQKVVLVAQPSEAYALTEIAERLRALSGVHGVAITR